MTKVIAVLNDFVLNGVSSADIRCIAFDVIHDCLKKGKNITTSAIYLTIVVVYKKFAQKNNTIQNELT